MLQTFVHNIQMMKIDKHKIGHLFPRSVFTNKNTFQYIDSHSHNIHYMINHKCFRYVNIENREALASSIFAQSKMAKTLFSVFAWLRSQQLIHRPLVYHFF